MVDQELVEIITNIVFGVAAGAAMMLPIAAVAHRKMTAANNRVNIMLDCRNAQDVQFKELVAEHRDMAGRIERALDRANTENPNATVRGIVEILTE